MAQPLLLRTLGSFLPDKNARPGTPPPALVSGGVAKSGQRRSVEGAEGELKVNSYSNSNNNGFEFSSESIEEFLDRLKAANRSEYRIRKLQRKLNKFGEFVGWNCNLEDVVEYLNERGSEVSDRTLYDDAQIIKQFLEDYGVEWHDSIRMPKPGTKKPRIVKRGDVQKFLQRMDEADTDEKYIYRAKTAVILSAVSGMRPFEIYRLNWSDVDIENRIIDLPSKKTKTKNERIVVFNNEAQERLNQLKELFPERPFHRKVVYLVTQKLNPKPKMKLKYCRKFFSQQWDRNGGPTSAKEMLVGHFGNVDLTSYNGQSAEDLKEIYDGVGIKVCD